MPITAGDLQEFFGLIEGDAALLKRFRALARDARLDEIHRSLDKLASAQERTEHNLAEFQRHADERFARIEEGLAVLSKAQERTVQVLAVLSKAQERTEQALADFSKAQVRTAHALIELDASHRHLDNVVAATRGPMIEQRYRDRAVAYFGRLVRRATVVDPRGLEETLEPLVSEQVLTDALQIDLVVSGRPPLRPDLPEVWIAVEVSSVIDDADVERARRRAAHLRAAGRPVVPAVAGERLAPDALAAPGPPSSSSPMATPTAGRQPLGAASAASSAG